MTIRRSEPSRGAIGARAGAVAGSLGAILLFVLLGLVTAALQGGCAERVHRRVAKPSFSAPMIANQGAGWDVVLPGAASAAVEPTWELARRDDSLNRRDPVSPVYQDAFASERLPTMDARTYLYLSRSERQFLYFSRPPKPVRWVEP